MVVLEIVTLAVLPSLPIVSPVNEANVRRSRGHEKALVKLVEVGSIVSAPVLLIFKAAPLAILKLSPWMTTLPEVTVDELFHPA